MIRRFSINFALLSIGIDALVVCAALLLATNLRPFLGFLPFAADYPTRIDSPWQLYPLFAAEWIVILAQFSVYNGSRRMNNAAELVDLTLGSALAAVALAGTLYLTFREISRLLFVVFVLFTYTGLLTWRLLWTLLLRKSSKAEQAIRRILILGAGPLGREVQQQIQQVDPHRLVVCGFLDDDPAKRAGHSDILGPLDDVVSVVLKERVQHIIMALPPRAYDRMMQLTGDLHRLPVHVWVIPDYFRLALHKTRIEDFGGIPMLDLRAPALSESQRMLKRAFDIIVSVISLPVAAPLIGLSAAAVWLETGRPVFFWQWRAGENGRMFRMLKLRTMRHTTGEAQPPLPQDGPHKAPQDPRVTRVGRFLRRTSLDELPQLYNVLRGEMSLVGPRPELPELVNRYETWQRQRFSVPQGITGWWQVNGRSDRPMHLHTEDDLYYVQNYSMILDLYILIKTVVVVLRGKGAF